MKLDQQFWSDQYADQKTGWDIGGISPQIRMYLETLSDKRIKILIPGCGNGYEAIWLAQNGFTDITVIDLAAAPLAHIQQQVPNKIKTLQGDFFQLDETFDLIVEQTFFCALNPVLRKQYVQKMAALLRPSGRLAGLLFCIAFDRQGPPFGGSTKEYTDLFGPDFDILTLKPAEHSIKPRMGSEVFFEFAPKTSVVS